MEQNLPLTLLVTEDSHLNNSNKPIGRRSAGSSFLDAYFRFGNNNTHSIVQNKPSVRNWFQEKANIVNSSALTQAVGVLNWGIEAQKTGTFHFPDPHLQQWAWRRMLYGDGSMSLLGIMHTLSSNGVQKALSEFSAAPIRPWDALICTSRAGKNVVEGFLDRQEEYLRWRHGASRFERPQLPIIPLGIDPSLWTTDEPPKLRKKRCRKQLGLPESAQIVLIVGRLDYLTKFQPDPLLRVLENLKITTQPNLELVIYGEAHDEKQLNDWHRGCKQLAPSVTVHWFRGKNPELSAPVRWAADVFVSLADNPQETFGITPLEAMASGLPCLVSDWDGYRDTVIQEGETDEPTGIRIPTRLVRGLGKEESVACVNGVLGDRYAIGLLSQGISIDQDCLKQALQRLLNNEDLRDALGEAGQRRVNRLYDWKVVIEQWRSLVQALNERRAKELAAGRTLRPQLPPCRPNISTAFGCYATEVLDQSWDPPAPSFEMEAERHNNPFQDWDQSLLKSMGPRRKGWWLKQGLVRPD
jgi:starch synthase